MTKNPPPLRVHLLGTQDDAFCHAFRQMDEAHVELRIALWREYVNLEMGRHLAKPGDALFIAIRNYDVAMAEFLHFGLPRGRCQLWVMRYGFRIMNTLKSRGYRFVPGKVKNWFKVLPTSDLHREVRAIHRAIDLSYPIEM